MIVSNSVPRRFTSESRWHNQGEDVVYDPDIIKAVWKSGEKLIKMHVGSLYYESKTKNIYKLGHRTWHLVAFGDPNSPPPIQRCLAGSDTQEEK